MASAQRNEIKQFVIKEELLEATCRTSGAVG